MYTVIRIKLNERAVVFKHGLPSRAFGPGRHVLWGTRRSEQRWTTDNLVFQALSEVRAILPTGWFKEVTLGPRERGILDRDGQAKVFLRPGTHRYWTVDPSVRLEVLSVDSPMPELTTELASAPAPEGARGAQGDRVAHPRGARRGRSGRPEDAAAGRPARQR
jgi:hypothetical protein